MKPVDFEIFREDVKVALEGVAKKHGVVIQPTKIKYSTDSFELKLEVNKIPENGMSVEQANFEKLCRNYFLKPEDYGRTFQSNGKTMKLIGFLPSGRKYNYLGEDVITGKQYKFTESIIMKLD